MNKRASKELLYDQVSRIGKAVSSPKRIELLELLAQGEKTVEALAAELEIDIRLASAHLRTLREARLVETRRDAKHVVYRLSGSAVATLCVQLRQTAEQHLLELQQALMAMQASATAATPLDRKTLLAQARRGEVIILDVRVQAEYDTAHLPHARSIPLRELRRRLGELPKNREIVAYCRGPFCVLADEALRLLAAQGYRVRKLSDGVSEWRAAGMPLATGASA